MNSKERILITGASGFIGGHLIESLRTRNQNIIGVVRSDYEVEGRGSEEKLFLNLSNPQEVEKAFNKLEPNYVIHLASTKDRSPLNHGFGFSYRENITISLNVIEACLKIPNFKGLIFLGSCDEYGPMDCPFDESLTENPINSYGLSKLAITKILSSLYNTIGFPSIVLRPSVVYGPKQGLDMFLPSLIQTLIRGDEFPMSCGDQTRDFVYVDDVVSSIIGILNQDQFPQYSVINIGSGLAQKIRQVAIVAANLIGPSAHELLRIGALKSDTNDVINYSVNIMRANELLGWEPKIRMEEGLIRTIRFYQSNGKG